MKKLLVVLALASIGSSAIAGTSAANLPKTESGITSDVKVEVKKQANGTTLEQGNIQRSYTVENVPGAIKHLYVISAVSGQTLMYSTVDGKVTDNSKSLTPSTVVGTDGQYVERPSMGMLVNVHGQKKYTTEVMNESGTYGTSSPYIYWWDVRGQYHKHYKSDNTFIHISDRPIKVKSIVINFENVTPSAE